MTTRPTRRCAVHRPRLPDARQTHTCGLALACLLGPLLIAAMGAAPPKKSPSLPASESPPIYFTDYPAAEQFCPPTRLAFQTNAMRSVAGRGRVFNQHADGGYGVPMLEAGGVPLYHTGADIGWFRQGDEVFAVADGVVRISQPGARATMAKLGMRASGGSMDYGNLIVIEHRLGDDAWFCSLYAHLGDDRRVRVGDLVTAGQQIGTVGRKSGAVNGGFDPHLHFGIREGRLFESGETLFQLSVLGNDHSIELVEPGEDRITVKVTPELPENVEFNIAGATVEAGAEPGEHFLPSSVLYATAPRDIGARFAGYLPSLDGWQNPIAFLKAKDADRKPAPLMFVTPRAARPVEPQYVLKEPAPGWQVDEWVRPADRNALDVADFEGQVVCLFLFDQACRASESHALPALIRVAEHFQNDEDLAVVGLQTPTKANRRSTPTHLASLAADLPEGVLLGHCGQGRDPPEILDRYHVLGTPWLVLIDRKGIVQFSNYTVRAEEIIRRAERLR